MQKHILQFPGPLRADMPVVSGTAYPDIIVKASHGPKFQAIPEWQGEAQVNFGSFASTANTRTGPRGAAVWSPGLDESGIAKADRVVGEWELPMGFVFKAMAPDLVDTIGVSSILYQSGDASTWQTTAVWGFERTAATIAIDAALGGLVLYNADDTVIYYTWAGWWAALQALQQSTLHLGNNGIVGYLSGQDDLDTLKISKYLDGYHYPLRSYYVDSIGGNDLSEGLMLHKALRAVDAVKAVASSGDTIGLVAGSVWRAEFFASGLYGVGPVPLPILDGADIIPAVNFSLSAHADAGGAVYETTLTLDAASIYSSGKDVYTLFEAGQWLERVASVAACAATAGTFYVPNKYITPTPSLAYVHPFGSTDPVSDGKVYEFAKRSTGINTIDDPGIVEYVHVRHGGSGYGVVRGGADSVFRQSMFSYGSYHNIVCASGLLDTCISYDLEKLSSPGIPYTFYKTAPEDADCTMRGCMSIFPDNRGCFQSVYAHGPNAADLFGSVTIDKFISRNGGFVGGLTSNLLINDLVTIDSYNGGAVYFSPNAAVNSLQRATIKSVSTSGYCYVLRCSAGVAETPSMLIEDVAMHATSSGTLHRGMNISVAANISINHNTLLISSTISSTGVIITTALPGSEFKHNIIVMDTNNPQNYVNFNPNVDSDYNVYIYMQYAGRWYDSVAGQKTTLAAWQALGYDQHSVVLSAAAASTLFLNGLAGIANGDFRLNPACTLQFSDGTPIFGNAGVRQHYNWGTALTVAEPPSRWPVSPSTESECVEYLKNTSAWDF